MVGFGVWWLLLATGSGQKAAVPRAADMLPGLIQNAESFRQTLPSLVCDESIISQKLKHDEVRHQTLGTGTFRLVRDNISGDFTESHEWKTVNGKPARAGDTSEFPVFMRGAFANGLSVFFEPDQVQCFSYNVVPGDTEGKLWKMEIASIPAMAKVGSCKVIVKGLFGLVLIDRATLHVTRMERRVPEKIAENERQPVFGAVDYGPVVVDGRTMWLPIGIEGLPADGTLKFFSSFTNFRLVDERH